MNWLLIQAQWSQDPLVSCSMFKCHKDKIVELEWSKEKIQMQLKWLEAALSFWNISAILWEDVPVGGEHTRFTNQTPADFLQLQQISSFCNLLLSILLV